MRSLDLVHHYFDREADRFDAIYERDKPILQRLGDNLFRRVILERYSLVINSIGAPGSTVLDVGCGPGRYGIELAKRGAAHCVGVDVSEAMVEIAAREAKSAGVSDVCEWRRMGFLDMPEGEKFDAIIAMGYFDYLEAPLAHVQKMLRHSKGRVFGSFPKRWTVRTTLRKARFAFERGFVRFYSRQEVLELFREAGRLEFLSIVDLGRDYIAIYDKGAEDKRTTNGNTSNK